MRSKRNNGGEMMIDHRASPGLAPGEGYIPGLPAPIIPPGGKMLEMRIVFCSHCPREILLNPDRVRARGYCPKCDRYICDYCDAERAKNGKECIPMKKIIDDIIESDARNLNIGEI